MYRSRDHRILAGVCGGIADSLNVSPTLIRVLWLILSLLPGPMWVLYIALWIIMPVQKPATY